ncbi:MAG: diguanylate cyclase [Planctomycetes bacterium]|nr:diguanylate cyclase [Planctomycetota bacterium]MCB9905468.1 diguanylate cyclase [Planctomycetota bacterium]
MPEFPTVNFSETNQGLFSSEEIQRLMRAECARAKRYGYPIVVLLVGVDRLDQLGDLYGAESRATIQREVAELMRAVTRASDMFGCKLAGSFLSFYPHTPRAEGPRIARRLLERTRRLVFDEGAASVAVTLSVGIASATQDQADYDFDVLIEHAQSALKKAQETGGDRFAVYVPPPPAPPAAIPGGLEAIGKELERMLSEKVAEIFHSMGREVPDFHGHEREVLELAVSRMNEERAQLVEDHKRQYDLLERRLAKLAGNLEMTEAELRATMARKNIDPGVASIYRTVQGLSAAEEDAELKREMMSKIFEANLELQKRDS